MPTSALTKSNLAALGADADDALAQAAQDWETVSSSAHAALAQVSKADMTEMRSYAKPHQIVQDVVICVSILFGQSDLSWKGGKAFLGQISSRLLDRFQAFDPDTLTRTTLRKVKPYIPQLQPEAVVNISRPAAAMAMWIQACYQYGCDRTGGVTDGA